MTVADRRARFHELHARGGIFVMPNPWDVGSARLLERCGFEALATTSAGYAWLLGKEDHAVTRDELVAHVAELAAAVDVPLSVDSERCFEATRPARRDRAAPCGRRRRRMLDRGLGSGERPH